MKLFRRNVALEHLEDFSWTAGDEEVTEFKIVEEPRTVELITTMSREPLTLNPCWQIELYLNKTYAGNVNRISVAIWADTGEVISCIPLGSGGRAPIPEFPAWTPMLLALAVLAVALVFIKLRLPKRA